MPYGPHEPAQSWLGCSIGQRLTQLKASVSGLELQDRGVQTLYTGVLGMNVQFKDIRQDFDAAARIEYRDVMAMHVRALKNTGPKN